VVDPEANSSSEIPDHSKVYPVAGFCRELLHGVDGLSRAEAAAAEPLISDERKRL